MNEDAMVEALVESLTLSNAPWSAWELEFIESLEGRSWPSLSSKQQAMVQRLYDKL
jgi:hypothetical protein